MEWKIIHISETASTNQWLREEAGAARIPLDVPVAVWADYQTAGRGCGTNTWESERGENLLFSMLIHPQELTVARQFHISMAVSLAICEAVGQHIGDLSIKWPNDIYWRNGKICGILIENRVKGHAIRDSIIGVGLNVNQRAFHSGAPNPVSMWQVCEHETDREQLLRDILQAFDRYMASLSAPHFSLFTFHFSLLQDLRQRYLARLYRRKGFHPYADREGAFMAELKDVEDDGHLLLVDEDGRERRYAFKEVTFI